MLITRSIRIARIDHNPKSMKLYYKTDLISKTGSKFSEIYNRGNAAREACILLAKKYGFESCRQSRTSYQGGISSFYKPGKSTDLTHWKQNKNYPNEFYPKRNTKEGLEIIKEIEMLPVVDIDELNNIIGYDTRGWKSSSIGFNLSKDYYGFVVFAKWECVIPDDCVEITGSEYARIFKTKDV